MRCSSPDNPLRLLVAALPYIEKATSSLESMENGNVAMKIAAFVLALSLQRVTFRLLKSNLSSKISSDDGSIAAAKSLLIVLISYILLNELHNDVINEANSSVVNEVSPSLGLIVGGGYLFADFLNVVKLETSATKQGLGKKVIMRLADGIMDFAVIVKHSSQIIDLISSEPNKDYSYLLALIEGYRNSSE